MKNHNIKHRIKCNIPPLKKMVLCIVLQLNNIVEICYDCRNQGHIYAIYFQKNQKRCLLEVDSQSFMSKQQYGNCYISYSSIYKWIINVTNTVLHRCQQGVLLLSMILRNETSQRYRQCIILHRVNVKVHFDR